MSLRMLLAAEKGETAAVLSYLEQGADINAQDEFGLTALVWAAKRGDLALTKTLLPFRPDLEAADRQRRTALLLAAEGGHTELVSLLLNEGASLGATSSRGHTLLHFAAASGQTDLLSQILAFESRIDTADSYGDTPLTLAVTNRHYEAARLLIEQGADINHRGNEGRTPLLQVVMDSAGREESDPYAEEFLEELLRREADVNLADDRGWTPLIRAAHKGDTSLVKTLLAAGADPQSLDGQGLSAFRWAARGRQSETMGLLRECGADVNQPDAHGQTLLLSALRDPDAAWVKTLLEMGCDPNAPDSQGRSPLFIAMTKEEIEIARLLAAYGAEINPVGPDGVPLLARLIRDRQYTPALALLEMGATPPDGLSELLAAEGLHTPDDRGWTPLGRAVRDGELDYARLLLRAGADVNGWDGHEATLLMEAVCRSSQEMVALLLEAGADVNAQDGTGVTALMKAVECVCPDYVEALLARGADVNAVDHAYGTALSRAERMNQTEMAARLRAAGAVDIKPPLTEYPEVSLPGWDRDPLPYVIEDEESETEAWRSPEILLPANRAVDCDCREPLERPVLRDPGGLTFRVTACMRCGQITYTEALVEEPGPHDVHHVANRQYALGADSRQWLMQWPRRVQGIQREEIPAFLPASFLCSIEDELERAEEKVQQLEAGLSLRERLLRIGVPETPAPADLPEPLRYFAEVWEGLRLTEETPFDRLVRLAWPGNGAHSFAQEILRQRPDFEAELLGLLRDPDPDRFSTALMLVQMQNRDSIEVVAVLLERLQTIDWQARELYTLLDTLALLGTAASVTAPALRDLAKRIGDADYYLTKHIEEVRKRVLGAG